MNAANGYNIRKHRAWVVVAATLLRSSSSVSRPRSSSKLPSREETSDEATPPSSPPKENPFPSILHRPILSTDASRRREQGEEGMNEQGF